MNLSHSLLHCCSSCFNQTRLELLSSCFILHCFCLCDNVSRLLFSFPMALFSCSCRYTVLTIARKIANYRSNGLGIHVHLRRLNMRRKKMLNSKQFMILNLVWCRQVCAKYFFFDELWMKW